MSDVEVVVALLSKVSDQVGTTAAEGFAHLVRFELIQGYSLLGFGLTLVLVGLFSAWKVWRIIKSPVVVDSLDREQKLIISTVIAVLALLLGGVVLIVSIPQVLEPTGSVVGEVLRHAVKK